MTNKTTIQLEKEVRKLLAKEKITKQESYNEIIKRLIKKEVKG